MKEHISHYNGDGLIIRDHRLKQLTKFRLDLARLTENETEVPAQNGEKDGHKLNPLSEVL